MASHLTKLEINCDMGEGFGRWKMGPDEELMQYIDTANIACGFHAGDPSLMLKTIRLAKKHGIKAGAHPGLPDLIGFGRRRMEIDPHDMYTMILYQVGALKAMLDAEDVPLNHVKPHGELFFYMMRDPEIRRAVLDACAHFQIPVYGCRNPEWKGDCDAKGIFFQEEMYVDIDYDRQGRLLPVAKSQKATPELVYDRIKSGGLHDITKDNEGNELVLGFQGNPFSICIHSDMPTALDNARAARKAVDEVNAERYV
ncbi:Lactam utilization protein lamB [Exophiala dermatitidis]